MPKEKKIKFGNMLSMTLKQYKASFYSIFKFMLICIGIPLLIIYLIGVVLILNDSAFLESILNVANQFNGSYSPMYYTLFSWISVVILLLFSLFVYAGIISSSVKKFRFSLHDLLSNGKISYFRFIFFIIIFSLLTGLLFLFLVLPGIIFFIFWLFGSYIYLDKKEGVISSLGSSFRIVRGVWWKLFGYCVVIGLIIIGTLIIKDLILFLPIGVLSSIYGGGIIPKWVFLIHVLFNLVLTFLMHLVIVPNLILFFKNCYFKLKESNKG